MFGTFSEQKIHIIPCVSSPQVHVSYFFLACVVLCHFLMNPKPNDDAEKELPQPNDDAETPDREECFQNVRDRH